MIARACKTISRAYNKLRAIESDRDLKVNKLTLSDYYAAMDIFNKLSTPGNKTTTFISNVAAFYENCGFKVALKDGNYTIYTEV